MKQILKKIITYYYNGKFRTKLFIIFGLAAILPMLLFIGVSMVVNENALSKEVNEAMTSNLAQIVERTNMNLEIYANMLYQMYQDEELVENINIILSESQNKAVAYNRIIKKLKQYDTVESGIRCISVICTNGQSVVYDVETDSAVDNLWRNFNDLRMTTPYRDTEGEPGMVLTPTMLFKENAGYSHYLHISKRIFDLDDLEKGSIATIVISIDAKDVDSLCNPAEKSKKSGYNFIISKDKTVICYPFQEYVGRKLGDGETIEEFVKQTALFENKNIAINVCEDMRTGWIFYNAYNKDYILREVRRVQVIFILLGMMTLGAATMAILLLTRQLNHSVGRIVEGMKEVQEGNLETQVAVQYDDEIGTIASSFNIMTGKIKDLIGKIKEVTQQQKDAEIRALEAQINPHFLYNTLDSINWMAIEHEEYEISKMLRNLGIILRYSVGKSNAIVKVEEMCDWMDKYISLQKMRFDDVFTYEITVSEECRSRLIHKLLIQPFIENAIIHGFKEIEGGGRLRIDIQTSESGEALLITIEDNGKGMSKELVQSYNDVEWAICDDGSSIGLHNAFSRMYMYYGEKASWKITSIEGMGTLIMLKLPIL
ncbi:MAG: histidine kinase [Lachnospiraceae bacterium]|nr:histidine kinase [Lachnospiraceae bacterium]